jgi:MFS family permease
MGSFIVRQLRAREPLLQLSLFRDRTFSWAMVLSFVVVTAMFGTMLLLPLYLQEVHGYDAIETGLLLLPQAAMAAVSMPIGGYLTDRIGPKWVVATGLVLLTVGSIVLATEILLRFHYAIPDATETQFASGLGHFLEAAAGIAVLTPHLRGRSRSVWVVANAIAVAYWSAHVIVLTPPWFAFQGQLDVIRVAALSALAAGALVSAFLWRIAPRPR